jgi:hypothetical protein
VFLRWEALKIVHPGEFSVARYCREVVTYMSYQEWHEMSEDGIGGQPERNLQGYLMVIYLLHAFLVYGCPCDIVPADHARRERGISCQVRPSALISSKREKRSTHTLIGGQPDLIATPAGTRRGLLTPRASHRYRRGGCTTRRPTTRENDVSHFPVTVSRVVFCSPGVERWGCVAGNWESIELTYVLLL